MQDEYEYLLTITLSFEAACCKIVTQFSDEIPARAQGS